MPPPEKAVRAAAVAVLHMRAAAHLAVVEARLTSAAAEAFAAVEVAVRASEAVAAFAAVVRSLAAGALQARVSMQAHVSMALRGSFMAAVADLCIHDNSRDQMAAASIARRAAEIQIVSSTGAALEIDSTPALRAAGQPQGLRTAMLSRRMQD